MKTRSLFELLRDHAHSISPLVSMAGDSKTVSFLYRCFLKLIAACDRSLDSPDIEEQENVCHFSSSSCMSDIASIVCSVTTRRALLCP